MNKFECILACIVLITTILGFFFLIAFSFEKDADVKIEQIKLQQMQLQYSNK